MRKKHRCRTSWRYARRDLNNLLDRLNERQQLASAA
jgi:hypothetical protein